MSKNAKFEEIFGVIYDNGQVRVEQLIVGYYDTELGKACGSVSLISVKDYNILVDCGLPSTDLKIDSNDVNCVIVTHWHSDHCGRLCDFHKAHRILPDNNVNELDFSQIKKYGIDESNYYLELLKLDGHSLVDLALVIQPSLKTDELIVIAGDLFENAEDYFSDEPAVQGFNSKTLLESRQKIRELNPSIVVPGHGSAFRLRPTLTSNNQLCFGQVTLKPLLPTTFSLDPVWLLTVKEHQILINTREHGLPSELMKDNTKLHAIVILKPSSRSSCALGLFDAKTIYMGQDILHSPETYSTLNEPEWIIDGLIRVSNGTVLASLKVEICDPKTNEILHTI